VYFIPGPGGLVGIRVTQPDPGATILNVEGRKGLGVGLRAYPDTQGSTRPGAGAGSGSEPRPCGLVGPGFLDPGPDPTLGFLMSIDYIYDI
jgi:hypothetical protein